MKEKTDWNRKVQTPLQGSGPRRSRKAAPAPADSNWMKAALAVAAGIIIGLLAKGVKDSDYYD